MLMTSWRRNRISLAKRAQYQTVSPISARIGPTLSWVVLSPSEDFLDLALHFPGLAKTQRHREG